MTQVNACAEMVQPMLYLPDETLSHIAIARRMMKRAPPTWAYAELYSIIPFDGQASQLKTILQLEVTLC